MQGVILGERDHFIDQRPNGLGLRNGGDGEIVFDYAGHEAAQQRIALGDITFELVPGLSVAHDYSAASSKSPSSSPTPPKCVREAGGATERSCAPEVIL